jgi:O-methyltransferase
MRQHLRRVLRAVRDGVIGQAEVPLIAQAVRRDARSTTFASAIDYVNFESVSGDVLEFGVFAGLSLAILSQAHRHDPKGMTRRFVGFDSFEGLPASQDVHPRWSVGACARLHGWHPFAAEGTPVTPQLVLDLFDRCGLDRPELHIGSFSQTAPRVVPSLYQAAAIVHVDCDLYESTRDALQGIAPALQDGTMMLFDDWFHYKAHPAKGEARAMSEFLDQHPDWRAIPYRSYGVFCNAFILSHR